MARAEINFSSVFLIQKGDPIVDTRVRRKLAAIFSADVKGYSRLMGDDELSTVETLKRYRAIITSLIQRFRGRVVDSPGDNILAEFGSVVDAVECAAEIQKDLKEKNAVLPENRRMEFRIGVHLGDVIEDEGKIYGDGVNVAARVEGQAEGGGISISGAAFDQIGKKLPLGYDYLGEHKVKNIEKPVRIYKVDTGAEASSISGGEKRRKRLLRPMTAVAAAVILVFGILALWNFLRQHEDSLSVENRVFPLPDKPSISVLPFVNMSGDKSQDYFSDGLTEEIITALSKTPKLFVIARNSSFVYKGKPVDVQQVSRELGVKYVLEGSVRRSGDQIRITAQLIDATTGNPIWAERYDRELKEIFAIQDEVTMKILTSLQVKLTEGEVIRISSRGTKNLDAYLQYLRASELVNQFTRESNIRAREPAEEALRLDPDFPAAYSILASVNMMDTWLQISKSPRESLMKAIELHKKALSLDPSFAPSHAMLGFLYVQTGEHEKGVEEAERAIAMAPNFAMGYSLLAQVLNYSGRPKEAIAHNQMAFRLNPIGRPSFYYVHAAHTYTLTAQYEDGIKVSKEGLSHYPDNTLLHARLAMLYAASGRKEEARSAVQELLRNDPRFTAGRYAMSMPYKDPALTAQALELMRKAGLPE